MAKFKVTDTREVPDERVFVLRGLAVDGEVHPGMYIRLPIPREHELRLLIHRVSADCDDTSDEVELSFRGSPMVTKFLASLFFKNQTFALEEAE